MESLNLPTFAYKVKHVNGKPHIFDIIRRKFVSLTPEEWVRQHFIHLLITEYGYPKSLFAVETGLQYNTLAKRTDIMILSGESLPFLLVECKAPFISVNEATFAQISRYNFTLQPQYLAVTNGMSHYCFKAVNGQIHFMDDFPQYRAFNN
ncbi:type I restriction enzyme HsdR N-terminal domain-containing protein [Dyadobacter chenwenxiniae]|uniref:Type I restriction enzyme HsdR N-terminal domain-containing protein n=1 Tax=Dyadobacter chenwenxiniae TaxID=2906456 RepID=A0A9X1PG84_9BACT|nr:type I restriction enzyme HsdR N-terminal domain-containing protein [Dyadobacter chenwenxiniae]MCF0052750.1 type I restriction enzyme HsdR N-terminal domain-containing protein [Dyadobacter chenwenxiniae]MCF0060016.1 type I restriction enzyme HsdR N-terminal domain-containing protein [Dyadobacter chenwenxiniae]UON85756.1 type I restriction enzyme HsdR N-terminal domain-containing protein [Dyadobacter chenwenxiniae]